MSRMFDIERNEYGTNMEIGEMRDISPFKDGGVRKKLLKQGWGEEYPNFEDKVTLRYWAYFGDEVEPEYLFDSSEKDGGDFTYECLKGRVVRGFELGVLTMKPGERAQIFMKPEYAFGRGGSPPKVPPETPVIFDAEIVSVLCPDLSDEEDRSILKKTLTKGKGFSYANQGAMVDIHIKGECDGRTFIEKDALFALGEGTSELYDIPKCVENNLDHWKKEEYSRIFISAKHAYGAEGNERFEIGPNKDLVFYIKMKNFEKAKEFWEMDSAEKMDQCDIYKQKGTTYFKRGEYKLAEKFYDQMVDAVQNDTFMTGEEEERRKQIVIVGNLNLAQAQLNQKKYTHARDCCHRAIQLDPHSTKGHYRRGLASYNLQEFDSAKDDFEKVLQLEPANKSAKNYVGLCANSMKQSEEDSKSLAKKMMSDMGKGMGDDRRYASGMNDIDNWDNSMAQGMMSLEEESAAFGETLPRRGGNNHGIED